jgi:glutathione S-transferase
MPTDSIPILYSFRRCPYAMRARLAIAASGQRCELREVVLRDKPAELLAVSPKGTVPVLVETDGRVIEESLDIMCWALARSDPQQWLSPQAGTLEEMLALIARCDGDFKHHLDRYKYANRYEGVNTVEHRELAAAFLRELEARLEASAWLFGDRPALADMAIAPFVRQFSIADPAWFAHQPWPRLRGWLDGQLRSESFDRVMRKYPQWKSGAQGVEFP